MHVICYGENKLLLLLLLYRILKSKTCKNTHVNCTCSEVLD